MNVVCGNVGYRELQMLADFLENISRNGIPDDVAVTFAWDHRNDRAYCTTENGNIITSDDVNQIDSYLKWDNYN